MFHIEMRSGTQVVRVFNRSADELRHQFLAVLARGELFNFEDHEWVPRETRLMILEGPPLASHQLTMGRGWPNARKTAVDVTERELASVGLGRGAAQRVASPALGASRVGAPNDASAVPAAIDNALRERLIGRLSAGPLGLLDAVKVTAGLHPELSPGQQLELTSGAVETMVAVGEARLELDGAELADASQQAELLGAIDHWLGADQRLRLVG